MSDTNTNETAPATAKPRERAAKEKTFKATLMRGANYAIRHGGKVYRFKGGVKVGPIPASLKDRLEETALDGVTITEGDNSASTEQRQKFVFDEI